MPQLTLTREIAAPAEAVFETITDHASYPDFTPIRRAELERSGEEAPNGVGDWHIGKGPDERAVAAGARRGIEVGGRARQVAREDFERFDWIVAMDDRNIESLRALAADDPEIPEPVLLRSFDPEAVASGELEVPDPYYGGEDHFDAVVDLVQRGCEGLLAQIQADGA